MKNSSEPNLCTIEAVPQYHSLLLVACLMLNSPPPTKINNNYEIYRNSLKHTLANGFVDLFDGFLVFFVRSSEPQFLFEMG